MMTHLLTGLIVSVASVSEVKLPTSDEVAVQNAARLYRIQVYNTFRTERPEFDRRHEQWVRLAEAWQAAERPSRDVPALLHWLEVATNNSRPESIAPLPEAPRIVPDHSRRRYGSAWQTILQRLAAGKLKAASGLTLRSNPADTNVASGAASSNYSKSATAPRATPVSTTNTLTQVSPANAATLNETTPVPGFESAAQSNDRDPAAEALAARGVLYQAYGERLGNNLGAFAAALVRRHAQQEATDNPARSESPAPSPQLPASND
jgi:hypothetical protein